MSDFSQFVLEQLASLGQIRAKAMFGGYGIYFDSAIFAIVIDDVLYLKTDDTTRHRFIEYGLQPFTYTAKNKTVAVRYYEAPSDIFEDQDAMQSWVREAIGVALKIKSAKKSACRGVYAK